jgi:phosphate transport system permease protein
MAQLTNALDNYPGRGALSRNRARDARERLVHGILLLAAAVSIVTTLGILFSLISETITFFRNVPITEYFGGTRWSPTFANPRFGVWSLVTATILISLIALAVALPLGLVAAIFLSEFASRRIRGICKPALEILAGVPSVVYGFFAFNFVTPVLDPIIPGGLNGTNALSAGLVMGIMIIPLVSSLSEDAMSAVPNALREGAYGLGATRFEVATRVVVPAALSGIVASVILALSRAIGETMIVTIAAGNIARFSLDPTVSMQAMTAFIVRVSQGDAPTGSIEYQTLFAVGTTLFVMTFALNIFSNWFVRRFREVYD